MSLTRPNIAFVVGLVSQFIHHPRIPHLEATYWILTPCTKFLMLDILEFQYTKLGRATLLSENGGHSWPSMRKSSHVHQRSSPKILWLKSSYLIPPNYLRVTQIKSLTLTTIYLTEYIHSRKLCYKDFGLSVQICHGYRPRATILILNTTCKDSIPS